MKKSEITRQKILTAAEDSFARKGLYGARVDEIAELAGAFNNMAEKLEKSEEIKKAFALRKSVTELLYGMENAVSSAGKSKLDIYRNFSENSGKHRIVSASNSGVGVRISCPFSS